MSAGPMHWVSALALCVLSVGPAAAAEPEVTLTRLHCGRATEPWSLNSFDDTGGSQNLSRALVGSCYLIRHGDRAMIWDTGIDPAKSGDPDGGFHLDRTLVDQLAELGLSPAQIEFVGISHYHYDHVGQAKFFPEAKLLIGTLDWQAIRDGTAPEVDPQSFAPWTGAPEKVEAVTGDKDVFGDGSVRMLAMPGHTPGHHSLLVRLAGLGTVLLTGDLAHFTENYDREGVPTFNTDRADTLASFDRFKKMAQYLGATVIIQHEPADIAKLPPFPQAAR